MLFSVNIPRGRRRRPPSSGGVARGASWRERPTWRRADGCASLAPRGRVRAEEGALSPAGVTGVQTVARRYAYDGPTGSVLVYLTAQGASCLGAPAQALSGRSVALDATGEPRSIPAVARKLSISGRQLERRFLARVGVSPRAYASLRRFERAVAIAKTAPSLTRAALDAGYYDQAHFNREVRRFTGQAPGVALR